MKRPLWMLLTVLIAIPAVSPAQYTEDKVSKISLRGGIHQPAGSAVRDEASLWAEFGIDYVLSYDELQHPKDVVSAMYTGVSKNFMDAKLIGLQYMRYWSQSPLPDTGIYYGTGVGVFLTKAQLDERFDRPAVDESGVKPGLTLVGGYHLGQYWFAELRYTRLGELAPDVDLSGLSILVGAKSLF